MSNRIWRILTTLALLFASPTWAASHEQQKRSPDANAAAPEVKVTYGPVARVTGGGSILITWSTNVSAGTLLHYGLSPDKLDQVARSSWDGTTHRIQLANLAPDTTYFYRIFVPTGQTIEKEAMSGTANFRTPPAKPVR